jgi:hypothetical protein
MLRRFPFSTFSALSVLPLALACNDATPTYPTIVIYGNPDTVAPDASGGSGASDNGPPAGTGAAGTAGGQSADTHCEDPWTGPAPAVQTVQCDLSALTDGGELSGDIAADQTLTTGHSYRLKGEVRVTAGVTLTIQPCVQIIGEGASSSLMVLAGSFSTPDTQCVYQDAAPSPGGKLVAVGEPVAPIVFTSSKPKGQRSPGDWGGVYVMGNARNNRAVSGTRVRIQGTATSECHGWYTNDFNTESSGQLAYVRVEYAGQPRVTQTSATSGLTFASVGSGTELDHVMVSNQADGCFGFLGGAVNGEHLVGLNGTGDLFDAEDGYSGKLQFLFGRQWPTTSQPDSHGFAFEGAQERGDLPVTSAQVSNFTLCGGGSTDPNPSRDGADLRHSSAGVSLANGLVTGFAGAGFFVQTDQSNQAQVSYVQAFANASGLLSKVDLSSPSLMGEDESWFLNQLGNSKAAPDGFCDCWANPAAPVASRAGKGTKPVGFPDTSASYIGAFADPSAASNWMRGTWTDWSSL